MHKYYIQQKILKILDHYPVHDENGEEVYRVDQEWSWFLYKAQVCHADGRLAFDIRQQWRCFLPRFVVSFSGGKDIALQSRFAFFHTHIIAEPEELGLEIRGDFWSLNYELYKGEKLLAEVRKVFWSLRDSFEITVHDENQTELVIAMVIMIDQILDSQQRKH